MANEVFGQWTVINNVPDRIDATGKHHKRVLVSCSCGRTTIEKDVYKLKHGAKMCKKCYLEILPKNGIPFERKPNKYNLSGECGIGYTSNGEEFYFDLEDYDKIKNYTWFINSRGYVVTTLNNQSRKNSLGMHQLLMGIGCDHKNRNPRNNKKSNLRVCTQAENTRNRTIQSNNTSGFIGVSEVKRNKKWIAYIGINGKTKRLGTYTDKEEAIKARLEAEAKYFGEFAPQRDLFEKYGIE